jgi:hypothetical protein
MPWQVDSRCGGGIEVLPSEEHSQTLFFLHRHLSSRKNRRVIGRAEPGVGVLPLFRWWSTDSSPEAWPEQTVHTPQRPPRTNVRSHHGLHLAAETTDDKSPRGFDGVPLCNFQTHTRASLCASLMTELMLEQGIHRRTLAPLLPACAPGAAGGLTQNTSSCKNDRAQRSAKRRRIACDRCRQSKVSLPGRFIH